MLKYTNRKKFEKYNSQTSSTNPSIGSSTHKEKRMDYQDLICLVGQYMTYEDFAKQNAEINIDRNEWYRLLNGNTYRTNKARLKERYLEEFNQDWDSQVALAMSLISNEKTPN